MNEYYVMKSKYKVNGKYLNVLTYSPEITLKKSHNGTYRYYRLDKLIWEEKADDKLFTDVSDGSFYLNYGVEDQLRIYPILSKYFNSTTAYEGY